MMRLLEKASATLKDQNSIWQAKFSRRTTLRNPDIEKAVIRATAHFDLSIDKRNVDRVCQWIRLSPLNLKPVMFSVARRVEKTRSWIVAVKTLYLMHHIVNSRITCVRGIGRFPFDLSNFGDGQAKSWPFNEFLRAYYAFLDQKSTMIFQQMVDEKGAEEDSSIMQELVFLQKLQGLVDLVMQIKPQSQAAFVPLILDVMNAIIIEIYDLYSRICRGIAIVLINIYSAEKSEATIALNIVQKATQQGDDLSYYFEFCQEIGVSYASEFPVIDRIPDEGIQELEQIIKGFSDDSSSVDTEQLHKETANIDDQKVIVKHQNQGDDDQLRTVITENWEKFDEDHSLTPRNPFSSPLRITYGQQGKTKQQQQQQQQELPDLIVL